MKGGGGDLNNWRKGLKYGVDAGALTGHFQLSKNEPENIPEMKITYFYRDLAD